MATDHPEDSLPEPPDADGEPSPPVEPAPGLPEQLLDIGPSDAPAPALPWPPLPAPSLPTLPVFPSVGPAAPPIGDDNIAGLGITLGGDGDDDRRSGDDKLPK